jgi:hypothetical protein
MKRCFSRQLSAVEIKKEKADKKADISSIELLAPNSETTSIWSKEGNSNSVSGCANQSQSDGSSFSPQN